MPLWHPCLATDRRAVLKCNGDFLVWKNLNRFWTTHVTWLNEVKIASDHRSFPEPLSAKAVASVQYFPKYFHCRECIELALLAQVDHYQALGSTRSRDYFFQYLCKISAEGRVGTLYWAHRLNVSFYFFVEVLGQLEALMLNHSE